MIRMKQSLIDVMIIIILLIIKISNIIILKKEANKEGLSLSVYSDSLMRPQTTKTNNNTDTIDGNPSLSKSAIIEDTH
jgi:hypothetical protein